MPAITDGNSTFLQELGLEPMRRFFHLDGSLTAPDDDPLWGQYDCRSHRMPTTKTNGIQLVLSDVQKRTFGPCLAAMHRTLIPVICVGSCLQCHQAVLSYAGMGSFLV
jgi:hypothetical protein